MPLQIILLAMSQAGDLMLAMPVVHTGYAKHYQEQKWLVLALTGQLTQLLSLNGVTAMPVAVMVAGKLLITTGWLLVTGNLWTIIMPLINL
jgi:hypothetical protein